jgi:hypothetical protein
LTHTKAPRHQERQTTEKRYNAKGAGFCQAEAGNQKPAAKDKKDLFLDFFYFVSRIS